MIIAVRVRTVVARVCVTLSRLGSGAGLVTQLIDSPFHKHQPILRLACVTLHEVHCPLGSPLVLRSGYEWRGCPQAVSRESHRTRNKNKQTNTS
jgi:hypothetical protein